MVAMALDDLNEIKKALIIDLDPEKQGDSVEEGEDTEGGKEEGEVD